jgi:hypothetical protein
VRINGLHSNHLVIWSSGHLVIWSFASK